MSPPSSQDRDFAGLRVIAFESRRAEEIGRLIRRLGGQVHVAPSMREIALDDQTAAFRFAERLVAGTVDVLLLLTGVGTRALVQALSVKYPQDDILQALSKITLVARGPKPIAALVGFGLKPNLTVPEPNTWRDLLETLDAHLQLSGLRVAVQEYGSSNEALLNALAARAAEVIRVPVYRWALPQDLGPLRQAVQAVCDQQADVLLFTSAQQIHHVMQVARAMGLEDRFREVAQRCMIASVGPVCTEALEQFGVAVDVQPDHPHLGSLLHEASRASHDILQRKRGETSRR